MMEFIHLKLLEVIINIRLIPRTPESSFFDKEIYINETYSLKEISVKELTPWLGLHDPPPYTGGYP